MTAHPGIDYGQVLQRSSVLVDLRGVTRKLAKDSTTLAAVAAVAGVEVRADAADSGTEPEEQLVTSIAAASQIKRITSPTAGAR